MFENRDTCRKIIQEKSLLSLFDMITQEEEMMLSERAGGTINLQNNVTKQLSSGEFLDKNKSTPYIVIEY
ncbi:hypothetical protein DXC92_18635 [Clostridiales bacterium TF09-2AC]|nr:hypothetical protein DXC92_18635 [Clostridiales bacterium TF09-2AC]